MKSFELPWIAAAPTETNLQRCGMFMCSKQDVHVPPRIDSRGNPDIQFHDYLVKLFKLCKGSVVIDVGGYIGDTAYALASAGCIVHSFEPFMQNFISLMWNTRNMGVTGYLAALGNGEKVRFDYAYDGADCGMLRVMDDPNGIPTSRLDDLFYPTPRLDLLKIDCEGREIRVLEGAERLISYLRPPMFIESYPEALSNQGCTVNQLHEKIRSLGYVIEDDETGYTRVRDLVCNPIP